MTKKVVVTGSSGFIAWHLLPRLKQRGYEVIEVDIRTGWDCAEIKPSDLKDVEYVFHLAFDTNIPRSIRSPVFTTSHNITSGVSLMEASCQAGVKKFLFSSTASLYGTNPTPWKEDMPVSAIEPYSIQKYALEIFCSYYDRLGMPTAILRNFQVFGEHAREDSVLYKFFKAKKEGRPITLTTMTAQACTETARRDFIHAGDVAEAFILAAESPVRNEIFNIGSGKKNTMQEIANAIGGEIVFIPKRTFEVDEHWADNTKARKLLGWEPKVEILDWIQNHPFGV